MALYADVSNETNWELELRLLRPSTAFHDAPNVVDDVDDDVTTSSLAFAALLVKIPLPPVLPIIAAFPNEDKTLLLFMAFSFFLPSLPITPSKNVVATAASALSMSFLLDSACSLSEVIFFLSIREDVVLDAGEES
jgi:hypothetical protein